MVGLLLFQILLLGIAGSLGQSNPCDCEPCKIIEYGEYAGTWSLLDNNSTLCTSDDSYWNACLYENYDSGAEKCFCDPGPIQYESCNETNDFVATDATVCLTYCSPGSQVDGCLIERGSLGQTLPSLGKQFKISYSFRANSFVAKSYQDVIALSTGVTETSMFLEMGIHGDGYMYFCYPINGHGKYPCTATTNQYPLGVWFAIEITQVLVGDDYVFKIIIDDIPYIQAINQQAKHYNNVNVYVSAPWTNELIGTIKNLTICAH